MKSLRAKATSKCRLHSCYRYRLHQVRYPCTERAVSLFGFFCVFQLFSFLCVSWVPSVFWCSIAHPFHRRSDRESPYSARNSEQKSRNCVLNEASRHSVLFQKQFKIKDKEKKRKRLHSHLQAGAQVVPTEEGEPQRLGSAILVNPHVPRVFFVCINFVNLRFRFPVCSVFITIPQLFCGRVVENEYEKANRWYGTAPKNAKLDVIITRDFQTKLVFDS